MADDGWHVVGASGRAKERKGGAAAAHGHSQQAHAQQIVRPQSGGTDEPSAAMPGWGSAAPDAAAAAVPASRRKGRRGAAAHAPRTLEEQAHALQQQVEQCRREVQGSSFYQRLRSACASTAHHALLHPSAAPPSSADSVVQSAQQQASPGEAAAGEEVSTGPAAPSEPLPAAAAAPPAAPWPGTVRRLVCYGLGSMQDSRTSRYQLALLLLLQSELLPGLTRPPEVYDPVFQEVDLAVLRALGLEVLRDNNGCATRAVEPTFFYLPHLEGHLCDRLLAANLPCCSAAQGGSPGEREEGRGDTLCLCVLLANSFATYRQRWDVWGGGGAARKGGVAGDRATAADNRPQRPDTLLDLLATGRVREVSVPQEASFPAPSAFNDTSLHLFHGPVLHDA